MTKPTIPITPDEANLLASLLANRADELDEFVASLADHDERKPQYAEQAQAMRDRALEITD